MSLTGFSRRRRQSKKEEVKEQSQEKEINIEQYHTGHGWYKLTEDGDSMRKDELLEILEGEE